MSEYKVIGNGRAGDHECGDFPTPRTFDQYIECECGKLFRSDIKRTYCKEVTAVYYWEPAKARDISWSISQGRLDPKFRGYGKRKWWQ